MTHVTELPPPAPAEPAPAESRATESRAQARYPAAIPIPMGGEEGQVLDLSAQGLLFESAARPAVGTQVFLAIHYQDGDTASRIACDGEVVRVECRESTCNIAVRLRRPLYR